MELSRTVTRVKRSRSGAGRGRGRRPGRGAANVSGKVTGGGVWRCSTAPSVTAATRRGDSGQFFIRRAGLL